MRSHSYAHWTKWSSQYRKKIWKWVVLGGIHISAFVVKAPYPCFTEPLTHILNLSVMHGVFSSELKLSKVIPLYKAIIPYYFRNVDQFLFCRCSINYLRVSCINCYYPSSTNINHYIPISINDTQNVGLVDKISDAFNTMNHKLLFAKV